MIRIPDALDAHLVAKAAAQGTTVTALLLDPHREGLDVPVEVWQEAPVVARAPRTPKAAAKPKPITKGNHPGDIPPHGRKVGVDALTGKAIYR